MSKEKTSDWHDGFIIGSQVQHEASEEHIYKPLRAENARLSKDLAAMTTSKKAHSKIRQRHLIRHGKACQKVRELQEELLHLKQSLKNGEAAEKVIQDMDFQSGCSWCENNNKIRTEFEV